MKVGLVEIMLILYAHYIPPYPPKFIHEGGGGRISQSTYWVGVQRNNALSPLPTSTLICMMRVEVVGDDCFLLPPPSYSERQCALSPPIPYKGYNVHINILCLHPNINVYIQWILIQYMMRKWTVEYDAHINFHCLLPPVRQHVHDHLPPPPSSYI